LTAGTDVSLDEPHEAVEVDERFNGEVVCQGAGPL
jgi:hypothetical protein